MTELNLIKAADLNFRIYLGDTWSVVLEFKTSVGDPIDITGVVFKMQVKKSATDSTIVKELTAGNGFSFDGINKLVLNTQTDDLPVGCYRYDLQGTEGAKVTTFAKGGVIITQDVTR
jgi:hypothetical protein